MYRSQPSNKKSIHQQAVRSILGDYNLLWGLQWERAGNVYKENFEGAVSYFKKIHSNLNILYVSQHFKKCLNTWP